MYGIVVVEDDNIIRKGIITMLGRLKLPCEVIGEAADGVAGLNLICEKKPDIVITDIKMPLLDGVEMVAHVMKRGIKSKVLVISGFDDYQYVRNAMKNGAVDYLLKPISRALLEKSVSQVIDMIEQECKQESYLWEIHERLKSNTKDIQELKLGKLLDGDLVAEAELDKIQTVVHADSGYAVGIVESNREKTIEEEALCKQELRDIKKEIYEYCRENHIAPAITRYKRQIVVIANHETIAEAECFYRGLLLYMGSQGRNVSISISSLGTELHQLKQYYDQAHKAGTYKIYTDRSRKHLPYSSEMSSEDSMIQIKGEINSRIYQLVSSAELGDKKQVLFLAEELLNLLYANRISSDRILEVMESLTGTMDKMVADLNNYSLKADENIHLLEGVYNFNLYKLWCRKQMENRMNFLQQIRQERNKKIVEQARQYIHKHYMEPINLTDLAEHVNLSPNYLSEVFRKEVGQTFIKYLINHRMQEAKYLLQNTDYKIYQVAEMVGYKEVISFNRAFKNTVGISPKEYGNRMK